jgi:hypothetical protein
VIENSFGQERDEYTSVGLSGEVEGSTFEVGELAKEGQEGVVVVPGGRFVVPRNSAATETVSTEVIVAVGVSHGSWCIQDEKGAEVVPGVHIVQQGRNASLFVGFRLSGGIVESEGTVFGKETKE